MTLNFKDKTYTDEAAARAHLESLQWPNGPVCPHCSVVDEATKLQGQSTREGVWKCRACEKPFSVTVGTVFERSHVPLTKWLLATALLTSSKKGMSSHQLSRMLGVTYKTAWFMSHRIREAMAPAKDAGPLGGEGKIVEADETYIGKKDGKRKAKGAAGYAHKRGVLSLVERGGKIRSFKLGSASRDDIGPLFHKHVHTRSTLHTDGSNIYKGLAATGAHESVDHNKAYVREAKDGSKVHTNTLEGFFSVFKRGMVGTYQHCGEQHLDRYLAEFDFRQNTRAKLGINDTMRAQIALKDIKGRRLTYRRTNEASDDQTANA
jgi:transposase-like protein